MRLKGIKNHGYNHIEFIGNLIEITQEQLASFIGNTIALTDGETDLENGKVHTDLDLESLQYAFSRQYETISVYVRIGDDVYPVKLHSYPNDTIELENNYWVINSLGSALVNVNINGVDRDNADKGVFIKIKALSE